MKSKIHLLLLALIALGFTNACTNHTRVPVVSNVKTSFSAEKVSVAPTQNRQDQSPVKSRSITAEITVKKDAILNQEFFFGADLQYSSIYDKSFDLYNQSSAMGHIPAFFRVNGKELQLVADNHRLFPSDVNHPERLISRYQILSETPDTLTISEANSGEFLVTTIDPSAQSPRDHWARSFEFVADGNYLLQESSVVLQDGSVVEVMESVFPRSTLAISDSFQTFKMDPEDATGGLEGDLANYRMLQGESIFKGEEKLGFAQHFDIGNGKTIDWYVTSNIKDSEMPVVRDALEGWNRYFRSYEGIGRDVVKFMGRLPDGVKLGDPRFNVINWDSRLVAGAAYESQASDPFTGKQSHSLIYMPVAWFQIGMDYWKNGQYSDDKDSAPKSKSGFKHHCMRDLHGAAEALHSGRMSADEAARFSTQLMKQTLFHEVGHALGLAHNFKGSLTFDRSKPDSMFSSSIMDYNDYEIERAAFTGDSAEGPLLEYDRQALSAIYNQMKDVKASSPKMAVCADSEADTEDSGAVDPLCIRYDIENDPTLSVTTALKRVQEAAIDHDVSLVEALKNAKATTLSAEVIQGVQSKDQLIQALGSVRSSLMGVMRFYYLSGKASVSKTVRTNIKSLYVFEDGVLPEGLSELAMRTRAIQGVKATLEMKDLSEAVKKQVAQIADETVSDLMKSPLLSGLGQAASASISEQIRKAVNSSVAQFAHDPSKGLVKLKTGVMDALTRVETLPYFFGKAESSQMDFESDITVMLSEIAGDMAASPSERLHATKALASFAGRSSASDLIGKLKVQVDMELKAAASNDDRELMTLLKSILQ
jgi:hypothetical protein